jgi:transcriptional regulator with XRE-family HTH domain
MAAKRQSQRSLAQGLGESQPWLSRRLRGEVGFTIAELVLIAGSLEVSLEFFTAGLGDKQTAALRPVAS